MPTFGNVQVPVPSVVPIAEKPFGPASVSVAPGSGWDAPSVTDTLTAPAVTPSVTGVGWLVATVTPVCWKVAAP